MQGAWVQSLVRELRSHMLWGTAEKKKNIQVKLPALLGEGWSSVGVISFRALFPLVETAVVWYQGIVKKKYC